MKVKLVTSLIVLSILLACNFIAQENSVDLESKKAVDLFSLCDSSMHAYEVPGSIALPRAQDIPQSGNRDSALIVFLQNAADSFSWKTFIAINWAAKENGEPDPAVCFGTLDKSTVWMHWMPGADIYVAPGSVPAKWRASDASYTMDKATLGKDTILSERESDHYPLIAQNKMYTMFEVFYNRTAYDYVVDSKLYSKAGQAEFVRNYPMTTKGLTVLIGSDTMNIAKTDESAYFSIGNVKDSTEKHHDTTFLFTRNPGAMIIKSAWMPLTENDDPKKFFIRKVNTKTPQGNTQQTYALVGLHIMHKVAEQTQWVWSTFEHINTAPLLDSAGDPVIDTSVNYLYFNKQLNNKSAINSRPKVELEEDRNKRIPTQVARLRSITKETEAINQYYQKMILQATPNSIWANYRLVGTQWAFDEELFTIGSQYQPKYLANTVLETYIQDKSSCLGCHSQARFLVKSSENKFGYFSDFVWGLSSAR